MKNLDIHHFIAIIVLLFSPPSVLSYQSTYELLQWDTRGSDTYYCIDILDVEGQMIQSAVACGKHLHQYTPAWLDLEPGDYIWKVWSPSVTNYDGSQPGFEGVFTVPLYSSSATRLRWGQRNQDTYYCVDLFDEDGNILGAPLSCGENMHDLLLPSLAPGFYSWKIWSPSVVDYSYPQPGFEGTFEVSASISDENRITWLRAADQDVYYDHQDTYYCLDILNSQGDMLHQAVVCGEGVHEYMPSQLNLGNGDYVWQVWTPAVADKYPNGAQGGVFTVRQGCGLVYRSDSEKLQWGCRGEDTYYCLDLYIGDHTDTLFKPLICGDDFHSFDTEEMSNMKVVSSLSSTYRWRVWSPSAVNYDTDPQPGFEGTFDYIPPPKELEPWITALALTFPTDDPEAQTKQNLWTVLYSKNARTTWIEELRADTGERLRTIQLPEDISGQIFFAATAGNQDDLWLLGADTLWHFDGQDTWRSIAKPEEFNSVWFLGMAAAQDGGIWVANSDSALILHYSIINNVWTTFEAPEGSYTIDDITEDRHGGFWLSVRKGRYNMPGREFLHYESTGNWSSMDVSEEVFGVNARVSVDPVVRIVSDGDKGLWVGIIATACSARPSSGCSLLGNGSLLYILSGLAPSAGGLLHYDGQDTWHTVPLEQLIEEENLVSVTALAQSNGQLWFGLSGRPATYTQTSGAVALPDWTVSTPSSY